MGLMTMDEIGLVPVTIVGGYLGAGKTTLINQLLAGDHGRRVAVLVNDFGSVNIDADLITSHDGETISLANGCVCCSIADALGEGLDRVLNFEPRPDQIIIEASGVADPAKVAAYGQGWPGCRLDAVLIMADVETVRARATDQFVGELVRRQLQGADVIALTKCDLVDMATVNEVRRWLADFTPAPTVEVSGGKVDWRLVLDAATPPGAEPSQGREHGHGHGSGDESTIDANSLFESMSIEMGPVADRGRLEEALAHWPDSIVRVKGLASLPTGTSGTPMLHVVQRVGRRWSIEPLQESERLAGRGSSLVVIAHRGTLDRGSLEADLRPPSSAGPRRVRNRPD